MTIFYPNANFPVSLFIYWIGIAFVSLSLGLSVMKSGDCWQHCHGRYRPQTGSMVSGRSRIIFNVVIFDKRRIQVEYDFIMEEQAGDFVVSF